MAGVTLVALTSGSPWNRFSTSYCEDMLPFFQCKISKLYIYIYKSIYKCWTISREQPTLVSPHSVTGGGGDTTVPLPCSGQIQQQGKGRVTLETSNFYLTDVVNRYVRVALRKVSYRRSNLNVFLPSYLQTKQTNFDKISFQQTRTYVCRMQIKSNICIKSSAELVDVTF